MPDTSPSPDPHSWTQGGLQTIPLSQITPNPNNPRKHFDGPALAELADSIKTHGVRQPILVRPLPQFFPKLAYQIVFGERRWRASTMAAQKDIPAIVDPNLNDQQALEISIFENLQREDVHPLEEAMGYQMLIVNAAKDPSNKTPQTAETIAAKLGKSVGYVYARLKLLALVPAAREAFELNRITPAHGVLIARLQPVDQLRAMVYCFEQYRVDDRELRKKDPQKVKFNALVEDDEAGLVPEKALREWIQDNINLSLKGVPWDLADANLVPTAGSCTTCTKRSTSNPGLFGELAVKGADTCFDGVCFQAKRAAFVQVQVSVSKHVEKQTEGDKPRLLQLSDLGAYTKAKPDQAVHRAGQWLAAKKGSCASTREGIMIRGEDQGKIQTVCVDASCKVHKHTLSNRSSSTPSKPVSPAVQKRIEDDRKAKIAQAHAFRLHVFNKLRAKLDGANRAALLLFFEDHLDQSGVYDHAAMLELYGWKGTQEKVLREKLTSLPIAKAYNLMAEIILWLDVGSATSAWMNEPGEFMQSMAKAQKLDIAKLRKEFVKAQKPAKGASSK